MLVLLRTCRRDSGDGIYSTTKHWPFTGTSRLSHFATADNATYGGKQSISHPHHAVRYCYNASLGTIHQAATQNYYPNCCSPGSLAGYILRLERFNYFYLPLIHDRDYAAKLWK